MTLIEIVTPKGKSLLDKTAVQISKSKPRKKIVEELKEAAKPEMEKKEVKPETKKPTVKTESKKEVIAKIEKKQSAKLEKVPTAAELAAKKK